MLLYELGIPSNGVASFITLKQGEKGEMFMNKKDFLIVTLLIIIILLVIYR